MDLEDDFEIEAEGIVDSAERLDGIMKKLYSEVKTVKFAGSGADYFVDKGTIISVYYRKQHFGRDSNILISVVARSIKSCEDTAENLISSLGMRRVYMDYSYKREGRNFLLEESLWDPVLVKPAGIPEHVSLN